MKKIIAILVIVLLTVPGVAFSQEVEDENAPQTVAVEPQSDLNSPSETQADPSSTAVSVTVSPDVQATQLDLQGNSSFQDSLSPQGTAIEQETASSSDLEGTVNPQADVSTAPADQTSTSTSSTTPPTAPDIIPLDSSLSDSTGTPDVVIPIPPDTTSTTTSTSTTPDTLPQGEVLGEENPQPQILEYHEEVVNQVQPEPEKPITEIRAEKLKPEKRYTFKLKGGVIAAKEKPDWKRSNAEKKERTKRKQAEQTIAATPALTPDDTLGALDISGSCSDPYFVILVYAQPEDYDTNPSSYIFNKAYPCVSGSYSYSLKELPSTLPSGTYYLLVGGQGSEGSWKPVSALVPIDIKNEHGN
ncbi:hypothetical protein EPN83_00060 [Patescibacteria group bacterium]|nr:MAG: hypothetical protein EPN83_00060 [Patescibacteria group bacterium]